MFLEHALRATHVVPAGDQVPVGTVLATSELDNVMPAIIATLASNIVELKQEQEECVNVFIKGKDIVSLLPTGFGKRLIYQLASLVRSRKYSNPIVVNADWLKAGPVVSK